jgi:Flp pilus assembly protein TadG
MREPIAVFRKWINSTVQKGTVRWLRNEQGVALNEFVLVFPILFFILVGIWDVGNGVLAGQKVIAASQMVADLIAREMRVSEDELDEIYMAGRLAMEPVDTSSLVIYVLSASFDEDDTPVEEWSDVYSASGQSNPDVFTRLLEDLVGMGTDGQGAIAVHVAYTYEPSAGQYVIGDLSMGETTYTRGRKVPVVLQE